MPGGSHDGLAAIARRTAAWMSLSSSGKSFVPGRAAGYGVVSTVVPTNETACWGVPLLPAYWRTLS